jgi:NitT/TauT family transport system substrate-binding protein
MWFKKEACLKKPKPRNKLTDLAGKRRASGTRMAGLAVLPLAAVLLILATGHAEEIVNLGIPNFNNIILPFYVAIEKGYYREEDLELRLIRVHGSRAAAAMMSGDVHFDVLGATAITARYNGVPLKLISSTLDRPFSWVYARPEVSDINGLKGQSIAVSLIGAGPPFFLTRILKEHFGWADPEREMRWLSAPQPLMSLVSGNTAAALVGVDEKGNAEAQGMKMLLDLGTYVRVAFGATAVTESLLAKNRLLVEKFVRGMLKGLWYLRDKDKKEDTIKILAKWIKSDMTYARGIFELSQNSWTRDGTATDREMKLSLEMSRRALKSVRQELTPANMYDFGPIRKVKQELETNGWRP